MSESEKSGGVNKVVITVVATVATALVPLGVKFLEPAVDKKGKEFAGVVETSPDKAAPTVAAGQTPETRVPADSTSSNSARTGAAPESAPPPVAAIAEKPREPRSVKNDLQVPTFENTPQVEYFRSEGEGRGPDRSAAIFSALEQALSKQGAQFSAAVRMKLESETKKLNSSTLDRHEESVASDYSLLTDGLIRWWDIESEEDDGKTVDVKVVTVIAKIKATSGQHSSRKTIAILPFKVDSNSEFLGNAVSAESLGKKIQESVLTYLANSRKFAVVDKSFDTEIARLAGERPTTDPVQRAIEAASKLGADYVVIGTADGVGVTAKRLGNLNVPMPDGMVNLRIIKVDSRQTMLASSVQISDLPDLNLQGNHPENGIVDAIGRAFSERSLEAIYPFKVAALNGSEEVILNRGGDDLEVGQRFDIANPGEDVKDPATGESLGAAEKLVGTVEVVRVTPKTAYAKVVNKTEDIVVGAICRKPSVQKAVKENRKDESKQLDNLFE